MSGEVLRVWHEERWKTLDIKVVGRGEGEADVVVMAPALQMSPVHALDATSAGMVYGQQAYILGFPYGRHSGWAEVNGGRPIPFVKAGVISAFTGGDVKQVYVDAHANEGFSGGPVVFNPQREPQELRVAAVVAGYLQFHRALHDSRGNHVATVGENTGIVVATDVLHVNDLIDANPIGWPVAR